MKLIIGLIMGLLIGAGGGYYGGTHYESQRSAQIIAEKTETWTNQINECTTKSTQLELDLKEAQDELKLNENSSCFITGKSLEAPVFSADLPEELLSNKNGDVVLNWNPVKGAKRYVVTVEDEAEKVISTTDVEGETKMLLNRIAKSGTLPETQYFVRIASVNGLDQEGPKGPKKPIRFSARSFGKPVKNFKKPMKKHH